MEKMLSRTEAVEFVCENLSLFKDGATLTQQLKESKLKVLNQLIREFHFRIPFQSVGLLMKAPGTQDVPTLGDIKSDVLRCAGGLCYTNNVFFHHLLRTLGYDVHHVAGTCNPKHPDNHIATLVHNVENTGDKFLVDVGCGFPTLQAVPLDFALESPVYTNIFLRYKFVRISDGAYERHHLQDFGGANIQSLLPTTCCGRWERYYDFDEIPRHLKHFEPAMREVYTNRFLKKIRVLSFIPDSMVAIKEMGNKCVVLKLRKTGEPSEIIISEDDLVENVVKLVPTYSKEEVEMAHKHWVKFTGR